MIQHERQHEKGPQQMTIIKLGDDEKLVNGLI